MKNINNITFKQIKNCFNKNNLLFKSSIKDLENFKSLNSIEMSENQDLTFLINNSSSVKFLKKTKAKACLIKENDLHLLPKNILPIIVENPYQAFALISQLFKKSNISSGTISKFSEIHYKTKIADNVQIDPYVFINKNCEISNNVIIESGCSIGPNVQISENTIIQSNSTLMHCTIGSNCIIKSGAVIGGTGFGFDPKSKTRIEHFGNVIINTNCNIGSNTTIDRAVFDSTVISKNSFIDNLVQIAHNVKIGEGAIIAAQTGIAGSTEIGKNVQIGGQSGISGHLKIGNNVIIAAKSGVTKNLNDNSIVAGFPAIDIKKWKLSNIKFNKL